jgi:ribonucleoside-diphosphate reductase alpha chain
VEKQIDKLLRERYFLEGENSWDDIAKRVSAIYPPIYDLIASKKFIPSTPTLMNANTNGKRNGTLSSCFTMGIEDSIDGIFESVKESAIVTKAGGGVGYDFSPLRGSNELVNTIDANSSGPLPFINVLNSTLDGIMQGGKRRGAGMGMLLIHHPNILDFIRAKNNKGQFERLNFSVKMTDEFYDKLKTSPTSIHMVKNKHGVEFPLYDNGKAITVKHLWEEIIEYAWKCAEPGIINEDIARKQCTVKDQSNQILTNPCSEYVNIPYSSCNLGSINLVKFVDNGIFDWENFKLAIQSATRFLNNVIDVNIFPLDKIETVTKNIRPIGLGVMGYAHMLYLMGIPYNSKEAIDLADRLFFTLTMVSMDESIQIAKECGASYPVYNKELFKEANERFFNNKNCLQVTKERLNQYGVRNSCFTSIAPTGSISYIANTSGGIEPVFALTYSRKIEKLNKEYETVFITDPIFDNYLDLCHPDNKISILEKVANDKGSCQYVTEMSENDRKIFVVASDLTPMEHLNLLGIVARNTSLSVSKTINLSSTATREEISEVYLKAHDLGIIGVTVYRDGCREGVLVHNTENNKDSIVKTNAPKRPKRLPCHVYRTTIFNRITNESEKWIVFVGLLNDDPYEIIAGKITDTDFSLNITEGEMVKVKRDGKSIYQFQSDGEVIVDDVVNAYLNDIREYITRIMSLALRHGAGIEYLKEVLQKSNGTMFDFNKSIIKAINKYGKEVRTKEKCPTCNSDLRYAEGCIKCSNPECSFSKCG